ncbi:uncharacterized protein LOC117785404 [Drosophila innubila]|uniref:uncharacterized protein LOC117785404 n=1 Tax=Drosophila innubila TaxID=198719 RepID=UPI00148C9663|nr:uncharacterized protein LOC117785404 [Drosophila innubila]
MKIIYITLLWTQLLVAETSRSMDSLSEYLESHDLVGVGNTKHCFARYLPQLEQVGETWSGEYNDCQQNATTVRQNVFTKVDGMQEMIRKGALEIDGYIGGCLDIKDVLDFFNCFGKLSKQQLTNMYEISFNASENALSLNQQLNGIDMESYLCTNRTEQSYVLATAHIFTALDKCLEEAANLAKTND